MATRYEKQVYERIKEEGITIHPVIWEVLVHRIRNDIQLILLAIDGISSQEDVFQKTKDMCEIIIKRVESMNAFLIELKENTKAKTTISQGQESRGGQYYESSSIG